jgi:hypothetical protein
MNQTREAHSRGDYQSSRGTSLSRGRGNYQASRGTSLSRGRENYQQPSNRQSNQEQKIYVADGDYKAIEIDSKTPKIITEEYLHVTEVIRDKIYDFNVGESAFRNIIRKLKTTRVPDIKVIDQYMLLQYVVCYLSDRRNYAYSQELISSEYLRDKLRYKQVWKREYFDEDNHDIDTYDKYHLMVRMIEFTHKSMLYVIVIPREGKKPLYDCNSNMWLKMQGEYDMKFPEGTKFIIKEVK